MPEATLYTVSLEEITIFTDCSVGVGELVLTEPEERHMRALYFTFITPEEEELQFLIPVESSLGTAILEGHLELLCKKRLDEIV
jgi:hypothetical protein